MSKSKPSKADPKLRKTIRAELLSIHKQKKPINRDAIKAKYGQQKPQLVKYIHSIVDNYSNHLDRTAGILLIQPTSGPLSGPSPVPWSGPPSVPPQAPVVESELPLAATKQALPKPNSKETSIQEGVIEGYSLGSSNFTYLPNATPDIPTDHPLLQDFKDHLTGFQGENSSTDHTSTMPSLADQQQLLTFVNEADEADENTAGLTPQSLDHSVVVSASLNNTGYDMPSQYALLGQLEATYDPTEQDHDPRVLLNINSPFSAFICGLQGSGKSHTTSCIIENCSLSTKALGNLSRALSTLVLHFNEYSSNVSSQPSEAAFLASASPGHGHIPVRVLVSPTNYHNLAKLYSHIPNVKVYPFRIQPRHLNISMMLSLMSMSQTEGMPLYMAQVLRVLREMAMQSGGHFDYGDFRRRLDRLRLNRTQTPFLAQRLDLLDSYLDLSGQVTGDYFYPGGVTILDLSCPFVDQSTACILFRIAIDLFLHAHPSCGKLIVADEAHKYMTDTSAAKELTETFLNIIRQQRHLGVRTVVATQEPTISPRLIDLCSLVVIHRFSSPEWYGTIRRHIPIENSEDTNENGISDGLYQIASLRTGEAIVFAPSGQLANQYGVALDTKHIPFKLRVRQRLTWDGGRTIVCVR
ncbi:hypothetical protein BJX70DRAFT_399881 [Aspergillus crustosus]